MAAGQAPLPGEQPEAEAREAASQPWGRSGGADRGRGRIRARDPASPIRKPFSQHLAHPAALSGDSGKDRREWPQRWRSRGWPRKRRGRRQRRRQEVSCRVFTCSRARSVRLRTQRFALSSKPRPGVVMPGTAGPRRPTRPRPSDGGAARLPRRPGLPVHPAKPPASPAQAQLLPWGGRWPPGARRDAQARRVSVGTPANA